MFTENTFGQDSAAAPGSVVPTLPAFDTKPLLGAGATPEQATAIGAAVTNKNTTPTGIPLNIHDILGTGNAIIPSPNSPIPATALAGANTGRSSINDILAAAVGKGGVDSSVAGLLSLYGTDSSAQKSYDDTSAQLLKLMGTAGNESKDLQGALDQQGVGDAYNHVKELNLKGAQLKGELDAFDAETAKQVDAITKNPITQGAADNLTNKLLKDRSLIKLSKTADLSATLALSQAYQGNATLGTQLAQQAVDLKYKPLLAQIDTLKEQLSIAGSGLSREDSKRSSIINVLIDNKKTELATAKANETKLQTIGVQAASGQAPYALIQKAMATGDPVQAASVLAAYLKGPTESVSGAGANTFTQTQTNSGASNAGMSLADFGGLAPDVQNYYVNNAGAKAMATALSDLAAGKESKDQILSDIKDSGLPETIQAHLVSRVNSVAPQSSGGGGFIGAAGNFLSGALKSIFGL